MRYYKAIRRTPFFKATSLNGISVIIKICIGLVTSKVIAVFVGPSGMALVGNLRNFISSSESIATLGFQNGIIKYVSESEKKTEVLRRIIATAFISLFVVAVVLSGLLYFLSQYWNDKIFGSNFEYVLVFKAMAIALPWYAISLFLISVINGLGQFKKVIYINIIGNIIGFAVSVLLIWKYQTLGALLSIIIAPSLLFFVTFYFINQEFHFLKNISINYFDFDILKKLSSFSLMTLVSAVFGPLVFLSIRNKVIMVTGIEAAGYWEAINRISSYYLMFISTVLTVYFLPKMALAKDNKQTKKVIWSYYKGIMPIFILGLIVIYFLRDFIIHLLFTNAFLPISKLFFWQLTGDILKAASMILGYQFFAKKMVLPFIVSEILSLLVMYFLSVFFLAIIGIQGIVMAHAVTYFIYLIILSVYFRKSLFG